MGYRNDNTPVRIGRRDIICGWIVVAAALLLLAVSDLALDEQVRVTMHSDAAGAERP